MTVKTHQLWENQEYHYPAVGDFVPSITAYLHEGSTARPAIVIVPGGGYSSVAPGEGEIVARAFQKMGYQAFVLTYTTNILSVPLYMQPLQDLSRALLHIREHADDYHIDAGQIAVCGFSAGGHLAASLAVHHMDRELAADVELYGLSNRPDAVILCYPLITSGKYSHPASFAALLGEEASEEHLEKMSLERHVSADTPPTFLWHAADDGVIPAENSYLFAASCRRCDIPCEYHVFASGGHGLSVATKEWESGNYGGFYTLNQMYHSMKYAAEHGIPDFPLALPQKSLQSYVQFIDYMKEIIAATLSGLKANEAVAMWPRLAHLFLQRVFEH